jgi:hypothetical protein
MSRLQTHRTASRPRLAAALATAAALAACSDDGPVAPSGAGGRQAAEFRRLLVADDAQPFARLYDLASGARVDSMGGLPGPVTYLYSAQGRVAAAHFQRQNRVLWIDGGAYLQNDRGVLAAPRLLGGMSDSVPVHGNYAGGMLSTFFDGTGVVRVWREEDVAAGNLQPVLTVNTGAPHHGAGMAKLGGQFVSASVRAVNGTSPDGVVVFDMQGARVDSTRACPGLHGLAGSAAGSLYGCADGALLVSVAGGRPAFAKLTNPDDARFGVGTVWGSDRQQNLLVRMSIRGQPVSAATRSLGVADVAARALRAMPLPGGDVDWVADLDYSGRYALALGRTGNLYVFDMATRQLTGRVDALVPAMPTSGTFPSPFMAAAEGVAYVSNPARGEVVELSLSAAGAPTVSRRLAVGGTPSRLAVLGVRRGGTVVAAN